MKIQYFVILAFIYGCSEQPATQTAPPVQDLPVITIGAQNATTYQDYPASVEGSANIEIRPQVTGTLKKIFVDDGAFVKKDEPLFRIESASFQQRLNNARAGLRVALGTLSNAQLEVDKFTPLVEHKVFSEYQLKTAKSALEVATGNVEQAKAAVASAQIDLGYTLIRAPMNGYIGRLLRKQGSIVGPADPSALTELSDVHEVHVFFALGEYDFISFKSQYGGKTLTDKLKTVPPVALILADDSAYVFKGKIDVINGQFDQNTGAITLRATFKNPEGLLRSGNTGKIRLEFNFTNEVMVPESATLEMQDQTFVYLLTGSNKVVRRMITIAGKSGTSYLVKSGLKPGDRIVSKGFDHLHEGDSIRPESAGSNGQSISKN